MHQIVSTLESELLPSFERLAEYLSGNLLNVTAHASSEVGGLPANPWHRIAVDCILMDARPEVNNNVSLVVIVQDLNSVPRINATVRWYEPSGHIEAEFVPWPVEVSDEVLDKVYAAVPRLKESLREALLRRKPGR